MNDIQFLGKREVVRLICGSDPYLSAYFFVRNMICRVGQMCTSRTTSETGLKFKHFIPVPGQDFNTETLGISFSPSAIDLKKVLSDLSGICTIHLLGPFQDGFVTLHIMCQGHRLFTIEERGIDPAFWVVASLLRDPAVVLALKRLALRYKS